MIKMITDSTSYIPEALHKAHDIDVIPLSVILGEENIVETEISNTDFFNKLDNSPHHPTSSQPAVQIVYDRFEKYVKNGDAIVACFISSKMSGTFSTANTVKNMILENYPDAKIAIIDSGSNCMQLGFAVLAGAKAVAAGKSYNDVEKAVKTNIKKGRLYFVPATIDYLARSGRVSKIGAIAASVLKIFPIITVDNGKPYVADKIRTAKKAVSTMVDNLKKDIEEKGVKELVVVHINNLDEALKLKERISKLISVEINISSIGPVIGAHVGPGAVGMAYYTA